MILTGTGTSHGIPVIGCSCPRCCSKDTKDKRLRTSAFIQGKDGTCIVIDTGPEFRIQALTWNITRLDAVLLTHTHADHLHGLDDVRIFSHNCTRVKNDATLRPSLKLFANKVSIDEIKERFSYIFKPTQEGGGKPRLNLVNVENYNKNSPLHIGSLSIIPVPMRHGDIETEGYLIEEDTFRIAYLTDCNYIPESSIDLVRGCSHVVLDGLRTRTHTTHLTFDEALVYADRIKAKKTWLTHICHDYSHEEINKYLAGKSKGDFFIEAAYDGLILTSNNC